MQPLVKGGLVARLAEGPADMDRVMAFRRAAFPRLNGAEADAQDALSAHVVVEGQGRLLAYFRVMLFGWGAGLSQGYAARFYDVGPLSGYARPIAEMGRFCLALGGVHPDVLRLAWGAMTRVVDEGQAGLLVGCTSFRGADWTLHRAGLALLASEFVGPEDHRPGRKAGEIVDYPALVGAVADRRASLAGLPPLMRTYLGMGGVGQRSRGGGPGAGHAPRLHLRRGGPDPRRKGGEFAGFGGVGVHSGQSGLNVLSQCLVCGS